MRIQIMPLPTETAGAFSRTPFVIVVDGAEGYDATTLALMEELKERTGASTVFVSDDTIDVGTPLELTEDQHAELIGRLGTR